MKLKIDEIIEIIEIIEIYDAYIIHASEDKEEVAIPLRNKLVDYRLKVWLDDNLEIGSSIRTQLDNGLKQSKFGIVILSKALFNSHWGKAEIDALLAQNKPVLPVCHKVTQEEVASFSPIIAGKTLGNTDDSDLAQKIYSTVTGTDSVNFGVNSNENKLNDDLSGRNAMRAFLQRCEVRLSTMHRIAGVFLNGAGLLILFPVFFRDAPREIMKVLVEKIFYQNQDYFIVISCVLVSIVFFISLLLPLYSLYLLLKDLVSFYFTGHNPGFSDLIFNPKFALSGIAFSPDESEEIKKIIFKTQYNTNLINFVLPFDELQNKYFDEVLSNSNKLIIPQSREISKILSIEGINLDEENQIKINRFNTCLGLAGVIDRKLVEEVAKIEASLVRHNLYLRRLVLRYAKALLLFIWTTLIAFSASSIVSILGDKKQLIIILAFIYFLWSILTIWVIKLPIKWIYKQQGNQNSPHSVANDEQLSFFEKTVTKICIFSLIISALAILSETIFYF
jgi:hypothetical protein